MSDLNTTAVFKHRAEENANNIEKLDTRATIAEERLTKLEVAQATTNTRLDSFLRMFYAVAATGGVSVVIELVKYFMGGKG